MLREMQMMQGLGCEVSQGSKDSIMAACVMLLLRICGSGLEIWLRG